jgi:MFS family permease
MKPFFYIGVPFRLGLPVIAIALWSGLASWPKAMLTLFFACMALFALSEGLIGIVYFDIMPRAVPVKRRSRLMSIGQFIGGLAGVGVGALVGRILGVRAFPQNYALLFACASGAIAVSTVALLLIREPPAEERLATVEQEARGWLRLVGSDRDFRRLMLSRILVAMTSLATPFYVSHAADAMLLPESVIGSFVIAGTAGSLVSSVVLGVLAERRGPRFVIRLSSAAAAAGPAFALIVNVLRVDWLTQAYPLAYVALGVSMSAWMLGFTNYMLEIAPPGMRPAYIGLGNTLMGLMAVVPTIGGLLLEATSYTVLFAVAVLLAGGGALLTLTLRPSETIAAERTI